MLYLVKAISLSFENSMIPTLTKHKRILIAPLHWGLGHATRCIPIIDHLLSLGKEVAIAGDSTSFAMLQRRYPELASYELPSYNVSYSNSMTLSMILQGPKLMTTYRKEIKETDRIVKEWKPDAIISDNRFGVRHKSTYSIYLTHQLNVQHQNKQIAKFANLLHRKFIHQFDECWIPDDFKNSLSGRLSDSSAMKIPCIYVGALTRLKLAVTNPTIDLLAILSGPEPSRTHLEKSIISDTSLSDKSIYLIRGTETQRLTNYPANFKVYDIVDQQELTTLINTSSAIICRSGYSTIMDLQDYDRPKFYIPTKGQTEQEYLAKYHEGRNGVIVLDEGQSVF